MRIALVHNPEAGNADHHGPSLIDRVRAAGYDAEYASTEAESLTNALAESPDIVLAAGGDGTVAAVARLIAASGRDVPLAMLPIGTANNIARSLGIPSDIDAVLAGLASAKIRPLDVGLVSAPWGKTRFVESAGVGLFGEMLQHAAVGASVDVKPRRGTRMLHMLERGVAAPWHVNADGQDLSGEYLMVVAMNTAHIGPALALAPDADAGDGALDLLLVAEEHRSALGDYLEAVTREEEPRIAIPTRRVQTLRLEWRARHGHVDDRTWPDDDSEPDATVEISVAEKIKVVIPTSLSFRAEARSAGVEESHGSR
jgi:diacylglycerol kinase family enzyme